MKRALSLLLLCAALCALCVASVGATDPEDPFDYGTGYGYEEQESEDGPQDAADEAASVITLYDKQGNPIRVRADALDPEALGAALLQMAADEAEEEEEEAGSAGAGAGDVDEAVMAPPSDPLEALDEDIQVADLALLDDEEFESMFGLDSLDADDLPPMVEPASRASSTRQVVMVERADGSVSNMPFEGDIEGIVRRIGETENSVFWVKNGIVKEYVSGETQGSLADWFHEGHPADPRKPSKPLFISPSVRQLDSNSMSSAVQSGFTYILWVSPACSGKPKACEELVAVWNAAADFVKTKLSGSLADQYTLAVVNVRNAVDRSMANAWGVAKYPTAYVVERKQLYEFRDVEEHATLESVLQFLRAGFREVTPIAIPVEYRTAGATPAPPAEEDREVLVLTDDTLGAALRDSSPLLLEFYAPWCGHCKRLKPLYGELAASLKKIPSKAHIRVAKLDATANERAAARFKVTGFPTILFFSGNGKYHEFNQRRSLDGFFRFLDGAYHDADEADVPPDPSELDMSDIVTLTDDTFADNVSSGTWLVGFFAPWCGHCKRMKPAYAALATELKDNDDVHVAQVDATEEKELVAAYGVTGFPTLMAVENGRRYDYSGDRSLDSLRAFVSGGFREEEGTPLPRPESELRADEADVVTLTPDNADELLASGPLFIKFYADWCTHCKAMADSWVRLASYCKDNGLPIAVASCELGSPNEEESALARRFGITGYPTLLRVEDGSMREYSGPRTVDGMVTWLRGAWKDTKATPLPGTDEGESASSEHVEQLSAPVFTQAIKGKPTFVKFYATWCGHCKKMAPEYARVATFFAEHHPDTFAFGEVDVDQEPTLATAFDIQMLPTLLLFKDGRYYKYPSGSATFQAMASWLVDGVWANETPHAVPIEFGGDGSAVPPPGNPEDVVVLTDDNFDELVKTNETWFVEYYAPWCGHCKKLAPTWAQLATYTKENLPRSYKVGKIDADSNRALASRMGITGFPTLLVHAHGVTVEYEGGDRKLQALLDFFEGGYNAVRSATKGAAAAKQQQENESKEQGKDNVIDLEADEFYEKVTDGNIWFVEVYAPWCGMCKKLAPTWNEFAGRHNDKAQDGGLYRIARFNGDQHSTIREQLHVDGYPTLLLFTGDRYIEALVPREVERFEEFMKEPPAAGHWRKLPEHATTKQARDEL